MLSDALLEGVGARQQLDDLTLKAREQHAPPQLAQQKAQANAAQAQASAAAIAEQIKQKMQAGGFGGMVHQRYLG